MVMATPVLQSLRSAAEDEIWAVGKSGALPIYNGLDLFDRFIPFDGKKVVTLFDIAADIKDHRFHHGVILPHSFRSALLFYLGGVRERIGYSRNGRGFMLTQKIGDIEGTEPTVEHYLRISDAFGIPRVNGSPVLAVTDDEEEKYADLFGRRSEDYVVFVIGAQYGPSKCWPEANFAALADLIAKRFNMRVYLLPGSGEEGIAERLRDRATNKNNIAIYSMGIRDLKVCIAGAKIVISNDTGPRHIAAALGVPTIVLIGPMDDAYTRYESRAVRTISRDVPCKPCNKKVCDRGNECLKSIIPGDVLRHMEEMLEGETDTRKS